MKAAAAGGSFDICFAQRARRTAEGAKGAVWRSPKPFAVKACGAAEFGTPLRPLLPPRPLRETNNGAALTFLLCSKK